MLCSYIIQGEEDLENRATPKVSNEKEVLNINNSHENANHIYRNSS